MRALTFRFRAAGLLPAFLPLLLAAAGCDLFSTRDPEPPTGGSSTFTPATSPDLVLSNLEHAVAERNVGNYLRCLVDSVNSARAFAFIPTAAAAGRYPATFASWSVASERSAFSALVAVTPSGATSSLVLAGGFTVVAADSAVYEGTYSLTFPHGIAGTPETAHGTVQFILTPDRNSIWAITRWIDVPVESEPSWSDLKGRFAN
jgi:hypothetical protein